MALPDFQEEKKLWRKDYRIVVGVDEVGRGSWAGPVVAAAVSFLVSSGPVAAEFTRSSTPALRAGVPAARLRRVSGYGRLAATLGFACSSADARPASEKEILKLGINDSKALKSQKRTILADEIRQCCLAWGIGEVGVGIINKVGIGKATERAMRRAIVGLFKRPDLGRRPRRGRTSPGKVFVLVDAFHIKYLKGIGLKNQKAIIHGDQKSISIAAASIIAKVYRDNLMRRLARKYPRYGWERSKGYGTREHQQAILRYGMTKLHRKQFVAAFLGKRESG